MKQYIIVFSSILLFIQNLSCQTKGIISTNQNTPLPFASIVVNNNHGCMTDSAGYFSLDMASIGDTLNIFHINSIQKQIVIDSLFMKINVITKKHTIDEITVSNDYAFSLLEKAQVSTYKLLKNKYVRHAYWSGIDIIKNDTVFKTNLDLDIKQLHLSKIGKGALLQIKIIDEHTPINNIQNNKNLNIPFLSRLSPFENNFLMYKDFKDEYSCTISESDSLYLLRFYAKKEIKELYNNIEFSIFKSTLHINYIASCTSHNQQKYGKKKKINGNNIQYSEINLFAKYSYNNSFAWLSSFQYAVLFNYSNESYNSKQRKHISNYNVYQLNSKERTGERIYDRFNMKNFKNTNNNATLSKKNFNCSYDYNSLRLANDETDKPVIKHH